MVRPSTCLGLSLIAGLSKNMLFVNAAGFLSKVGGSVSSRRAPQLLQQGNGRFLRSRFFADFSPVTAIFLSRGGGFPPTNGDSTNGDSDNGNNHDFGSGFPGIPFPGSGSSSSTGGRDPPNKGDVYSDDELFNLLQLHQDINDQMIKDPKNGDEDPVVLPGEEKPDQGAPSLHDLVMQTVQQVDQEQQQGTTNGKSQETEDGPTILQRKVRDIIAIASDVDGTLLSSSHKLHPRTDKAIRQAVQQISSPDGNLQYFFPATGKSRKGALDSLGPEIRDLLSQLPGVFIQGLYCVDGDGNVLFEQKLPNEAVKKAEELAAKLGITVLGYDGDYLYSNSAGDPIQVKEIHEKWGEPMPKPLSSLMDHDSCFHKLLFMHHDVQMLSTEMRPELEALANDNQATVTTAVPTMLELLPEGCSKADGVQKLCEALGIDPTKQLLAIGDAENDVGMLKLAAIGVAVNNACDKAKESADVVMEESSDDGAAGVAMEQYSMINR